MAQVTLKQTPFALSSPCQTMRKGNEQTSKFEAPKSIIQTVQPQNELCHGIQLFMSL
jgi:hypothetical protein